MTVCVRVCEYICVCVHVWVCLCVCVWDGLRFKLALLPPCSPYPIFAHFHYFVEEAIPDVDCTVCYLSNPLPRPLTTPSTHETSYSMFGHYCLMQVLQSTIWLPQSGGGHTVCSSEGSGCNTQQPKNTDCLWHLHNWKRESVPWWALPNH